MTTPASDGDPGGFRRAGRSGAVQRDGPGLPDAGVRLAGRWLPDVAAVLSFVLLAGWVTARFWLDPTQESLVNATDQAQFEWMMAHGARVVTDFAYPFGSDRMNVPDGVNLMANTSVLSVSLPMTPITELFGPRAAFLLFLTSALAATGTAWYFVISRVLVPSRPAAWTGALFCAFSPAMISHANAHPNIVAQYVVPLIVWRTLALRRPGRWLRNGVLLGSLIVWQTFLNPEILLMTAVGLGVVVAVLLLRRPDLRRDTRPFLAGLAVAAGFSLVLLAYPLYVMLLGPGAYDGLSALIRGYSSDLASFFAWPGESLAGDPRDTERLARNPTEENAFFGWPLVVLTLALVWWLRGRAEVLGLAAVGVIFTVLSLGRELRYDGQGTGVPAPWAALENLPILHSVVPTRWALALTPVVGLLLAYGVGHAAGLTRRHPAARRQIRFATGTVLLMALLPLTPTPLPTTRMDPVPEFVTSGAWRPYLAGGRSLVTLPMPDTDYADPLRWSAVTGLELPIARGYFLGPDRRPDAPEGRIALFGATPRPTSTFFTTIRRTGAVPPITPQTRVAAVDDLRYWRAGAVALAGHRHEDALRRGMTELTGIEPVRTGGVWLWDVRPLVD
ncbi:hypothetical protein O7606_20640 [Micromonospora sp. WMMD882]|uniref:hypothetical protein n=1 Tax=Micromonospora sp. WMMD882 TaxID=3015151 RepID=UPI00248C8AC4|nr:hypothetical protein [Micromonospora sp. WMMD882]WBB78604.1 hypothetical protein O7606_20640 [Micromonospora sp. WMMD882]